MRAKDYQRIAAAVNAEFEDSRACSGPEYGAGQRFAATMIGTRLADLFQADSPSGFDRARFLSDCGIIEEAR